MVYTACKAVVLPLVSAVDLTEQNKEGFDATLEQNGGGKAKYTLAYIVQLVLFIGAAYLAWQCNAGEGTGMRILYTVLAAIFSTFYLIYYLIYRVIMGNKCG
jgi:hypothetical protein